MAMTLGPDNSHLDDPVTFLFTEGSALPNGPDGRGVHITYPDRTELKGLWEPVCSYDREEPQLGGCLSYNQQCG